MLPKNFFHRKRTVLINILHFPWKKIFSQYTEIHSPAATMFLVRLLDKNIFLQIVEDCIDDLQTSAFKERIVADLLYVRSDRYFRKLLAAVESLYSDRCYFIGRFSCYLTFTPCVSKCIRFFLFIPTVLADRGV